MKVLLIADCRLLIDLQSMRFRNRDQIRQQKEEANWQSAIGNRHCPYASA
ncbi:MAG TPA: hypothetical protein VIK24_20990 [Pyrinomonadaceae bacterium]|jgi:hypothetical protein